MIDDGKVPPSGRAAKDAYAIWRISTGLERLIASDSDNLEVTFRFRLRGAALLSDEFGGSLERLKLLSKVYDLRSKVVHGRAPETELAEYTPKAEAALREVFLWFLSHPEARRRGTRLVEELDAALVAGGAEWTRAKTSDLESS